MPYARVAISRFRPGTDVDEIAAQATQAVAYLRRQPGFLSYTAVRVGDDTAIVMSLWATREEGEQGVTVAER